MNLNKCDTCAARNIICHTCEKNRNYVQGHYSYNERIKRVAIEEYKTKLTNAISEACFPITLFNKMTLVLKKDRLLEVIKELC